jgi:hypothetical protein
LPKSENKDSGMGRCPVPMMKADAMAGSPDAGRPSRAIAASRRLVHGRFLAVKEHDHV